MAQRFLLGRQPSLEAQLCNLADAIAYNAHDVDDGVRSGLITMAQLREAVPLFARYHDATLAEHPQLGMPLAERRLLYESIRRMLSDQVYDVIAATQQRIAQARPCSVDEVRAQAGPLVGFSDTMRQQSLQLKQFLFRNLYRHEQVMKTMDGAQQVVAELFAAYMVCLLYTSPSPRDLSTSRMPSSA